ncbi:MAG TPA: DUF2125 domain-containing protein [Phenylobacterium sp.]|uniref:DUF2125 domain-containing protein n=1 Tax=Phenylobacterium sp. TaxID=1871053 RepID=UPI002B4A2F02|nr:DUF2125 domain-containing protein [Phenylobacterium sp.]HKR89969.1 DUF2125 domain-containing protein [Phenylobacterium sp.]
MSVHDPLAARKPRRLGLYLPFVLLLLAALAWTFFWFWMRGEVQKRMDASVADLGRGGYQVSWGRRSLGGYPFRMDVSLTEVKLREPSGWALQAPLLEGEAFPYAPGHWMLAAPQGLTFVRPVGGPVAITGQVLRASLTDFAKRPPSFSFQGEGLSFQPAAGAEPFALTAADLVEFHLRAGPDDEGGVFARLDGGKARPDGVFGRIAAGKPVSLVWNSTLSKMSAFTGRDWAEAVQRWSDAGGQMNVRDTSKLAAGEALVAVKSGALGVGRDGRLRGVMDVGLRQAPRALGTMAQSGVLPSTAADAASAVATARQAGDSARATLNFEAGQITLGPVALGPAPKVYTPR